MVAGIPSPDNDPFDWAEEDPERRNLRAPGWISDHLADEARILNQMLSTLQGLETVISEEELNYMLVYEENIDIHNANLSLRSSAYLRWLNSLPTASRRKVFKYNRLFRYLSENTSRLLREMSQAIRNAENSMNALGTLQCELRRFTRGSYYYEKHKEKIACKRRIVNLHLRTRNQLSRRMKSLEMKYKEARRQLTVIRRGIEVYRRAE